MMAVLSRPTMMREELQRSVDYYLKTQTVDESLLIYGVKPFSNVHGVEFSFERGYPRVSLMEVVCPIRVSRSLGRVGPQGRSRVCGERVSRTIVVRPSSCTSY